MICGPGGAPNRLTDNAVPFGCGATRSVDFALARCASNVIRRCNSSLCVCLSGCGRGDRLEGCRSVVAVANLARRPIIRVASETVGTVGPGTAARCGSNALAVALRRGNPIRLGVAGYGNSTANELARFGSNGVIAPSTPNMCCNAGRCRTRLFSHGNIRHIMAGNYHANISGFGNRNCAVFNGTGNTTMESAIASLRGNACRLNVECTMARKSIDNLTICMGNEGTNGLALAGASSADS